MEQAQTPVPAARKSAAPVDIYVGGRARMRRKMLAMSQQNLAAALGITFQQIQNTRRAQTGSAPAGSRR